VYGPVLLVVRIAGHISSPQELVTVIVRLSGMSGIEAGGDIRFGILVGAVTFLELVEEAIGLALFGICC
jgi:hypothetical protein